MTKSPSFNVMWEIGFEETYVYALTIASRRHLGPTNNMYQESREYWT